MLLLTTLHKTEHGNIQDCYKTAFPKATANGVHTDLVASSGTMGDSSDLTL